MMRLSATYILGSIVLLNAAVAEELVYRDWRGSPDFVNGLFLGCHLVSPESRPEPERIEVAATDGLQFHIVYYAQYDTPPPVNKKLMVDVVLYDQENVFKSKSIWSGRDYVITTIGQFKQQDGNILTKERLSIHTVDDIMPELRNAIFLEVFWHAVPPFSKNWSLIDLRKGSFSFAAPQTWLDSNDTYGAIQAVIDCASRHTGQVDPAGRARFAYETSLKLSLDNRATPFADQARSRVIDAGYRYCQVKKATPYNKKLSYYQNILDTVNKVSKILSHDWGEDLNIPKVNPVEMPPPLAPGEPQKLPEMPSKADEISFRDMAMLNADRLLCPGWPDYSRPRYRDLNP